MQTDRLQPDSGLAGIKGVHNAQSGEIDHESWSYCVFIPIVAIVMGIGIGMLAIWSEHKRKSQLLEQNHRERMHAIEKGIELPPLPPNLGRHEQRTRRRASAAKSLRSGVMLLLIGIVLYLRHRRGGRTRRRAVRPDPGRGRHREPRLCRDPVGEGKGRARRSRAAADAGAAQSRSATSAARTLSGDGRDLVLIVRVVDADGQARRHP